VHDPCNLTAFTHFLKGITEVCGAHLQLYASSMWMNVFKLLRRTAILYTMVSLYKIFLHVCIKFYSLLKF